MNHAGEFVEYKFHLYQSLLFQTTITLVCGLQAQCIPRLHFMPIPVGKVIIVKNIIVIGKNELHLDMRTSNEFQLGVLNLSRYKTDLEAYCTTKKYEWPIQFDHEYCMNMDVNAFPNWGDEIFAFRQIAKFIRRCQRIVMLCKYNPSMAQSSTDTETSFICQKLIVSPKLSTNDLYDTNFKGKDPVIVEYLHLNQTENIHENFTYQLLVFVADVQDKLTVFQGDNIKSEIAYPPKLKMVFKNVQCQLVLINGIRVRSGVIEISKLCSMIRVLQREIGDVGLLDKKKGLPVCPKLSHPQGQYKNWPTPNDEEGYLMLKKVYPVVQLFFERCSLINMLPVGKFKITTEVDSFLLTKSIYNEWAFLDRKVANTRHLTKKLRANMESQESNSLHVESSSQGESEQTSMELDQEALNEQNNLSSSSNDSTPKKNGNPLPLKRVRKTNKPQSEQVNDGPKKSRRTLFVCSSEEEYSDNVFASSGEEETINLLMSSEESESEDQPTVQDQEFIDDGAVTEINVRPRVLFSPNQQQEFQKAVTHFQNNILNKNWIQFQFKFLRTRDFCQIICQSLPKLRQNEITLLEEFVQGQTPIDDEIEALFQKIQNAPINFSFEF